MYYSVQLTDPDQGANRELGGDPTIHRLACIWAVYGLIVKRVDFVSVRCVDRNPLVKYLIGKKEVGQAKVTKFLASV